MTNADIRQKAVDKAIAIARDDTHGYSQISRNGPDYDCSSLVLYCYSSAGANTNGATYTGNMRDCLQRAGWQVLPASTQLQAGDILLNNLHHTAIYIGNGQLVEAFGDERGGIGHGAQTGDQTGREIRIAPYYVYSAGWDHVLRLPDNAPEEPSAAAPLQQFGICRIPIINKGDVSPATCAAQAALNYHGYGPIQTDGVFGPQTETAVLAFQKKNGLQLDGIIGPSTWAKLMTWRN